MDAATSGRGVRRIAHLVVTAGEPAGIGPEICNALVETHHAADVVVVGDASLLDDRLQVIDMPFPAPVVCGQPDLANAQTILDGLKIATEGCLSGRFAAMITAPVAKNVIAAAGMDFTGHTEYLADLTDTELPVMMLVAGDLRVALASTHLPLRNVPDYITAERLQAVIEVLEHDLRTRFGFNAPEIIVCGLNPHAGENGLLGTEDNAIIAPTVAKLAQQGLNIRGPIPADTAFTAAAGSKDAVLAMYHDQGLPVLKYAAFGHAVNVTLGLPIIRTSVDHGTAFDIAGTGSADAGSLLAAIELAATLADQ